MADNFLKIYNGATYVPRSTDPLNPVEGDVQFADGTVRTKGLWEYKDGAWAQVGGGSGGLNIFFTEDFEATSASDLTSGKDPIFDNLGTLGGALTDETASPIAANKSLKYTTHATPGSSDNDFFYLPAITLDAKQKGNDIGLSFYYTWDGSDDLIEVVIYDDTGNVVLTSPLDLIKTKSNPTRYSTSVFVPTTSAALKVGFHHTGTSEASKVLVVDDIELSTDPFVYKNLGAENVFSAYIANNGSTASITSQSSEFISSVNRDSQGIVTITWVSGFFTEVPSVVFGPETDTTGNPAQMGWTSLSTTSMVVETAIYTSAFDDFDFSIMVQNQGADYNTESEHVVTPANAGTEFFTMDHETALFWDSTALTRNFDTSLLPLTSSEYVEYNDTTETRIVAKRDIVLDINVTAALTANNLLAIEDSSGSRLSFEYAPGVGVNSTAIATIKLSANDYISFTKTTSSTRNGGLSIRVRDANVNFLAAVPVQKIAYIKDVKAAATDAGTFTSGAWQTRDLNTLEGDSSFISLSANQFTLGAGQYDIDGWANSRDVDNNKAALYNVTDANFDILGSTTNSADGLIGESASVIKGTITITSAKTFEIQHRCQTTRLTDGFGQAIGMTGGTQETFTQVKITKLR